MSRPTWAQLPDIVRSETAGRVARLVVVALTVWLMAAPSLFDYQDTAAADSDRIIGPIAGAFAFVALWDILVAMRWMTVPCGLWLVLAPLVLDAGTATWPISSVTTGVIILVAAVFGADPRDRFDGGWRSVRPSRWTSPADS